MLRLINLGLLIAFQFCYMAWGTDMSSYIYQVEYTLFFEGKNLIDSLSHPLILAGIIGQLILLYAAIVKKTSVAVNLFGVVGLGVVVLLILLAGSLSLQIHMILSTLPYIALSVLFFIHIRKKSKSMVAD